jgi:hypothetical protein
VFFYVGWTDFLIFLGPFGSLYHFKHTALYRLRIMASDALLVGVMSMVTRHVVFEGGFDRVEGLESVVSGTTYVVGQRLYRVAEPRGKQKGDDSLNGGEDEP